MNPKETSRILDAVAGDFIRDDVNLLPQIATRFERKTFMQTLRARPALILLLVLLTLSLLTGVVYAVGRTFGYIPGVGLVEDGTQVRVLAEPVSLTRDGITVTITDATLTSEQSILIYQTVGIPNEARPKGESGSRCNGSSTPNLKLPDGSMLSITSGEGTLDTMRMILPPVPAGMNDVTFFLACLADVAPGKTPQNWEIPLHFKPAPPSLTVMPVIELVTPVPTQTQMPVLASKLTSDPFLGITLNIDSLTHTERGYILQASIQWPEKLSNRVSTRLEAVSLLDATGKKLEMVYLEDSNQISSSDPYRNMLSFSLPDQTFSAPLTLEMSLATIDLIEKPQFTFDPGANPQPGQSWPLNQKLEVAGFPLQIESAQFIPNEALNKQDWMRFNPQDMVGFNFSFAPNPAIQLLSLSVKSGYSADGSGRNGFSELGADGRLESSALLNGKIIAPLTIEASYVGVRHPWQISFDPAAIMTTAISTPVSDSASLNASIQIEKVIPLEDGYYIIGRTIWNDPRFSQIALGDWDAKLRDANGVETPMEPVGFDEMGMANDFAPDKWAFHVYGKVLPKTLTLSMSRANLHFSQPYTFSFDPGAKQTAGQEWQMNQPLEILGYKTAIQKAAFMQMGDLHGFEFSFIADPALESISISIQSGITGGHGGGGGGPAPRDENGVMKVSALSDGQFNGPILFSISDITFNGHWQTEWNPPAAPAGAVPFAPLQACVTLEKWKQAVGSGNPIPAGLPPRILVSRGAIAPNPSLFIANLDGSNEQGLVFSRGGSLSPDGTQLVYSDDALHIKILEIASKQESDPGVDGSSPFWSPDGKKIAFTNPANDNILIMNADGSNPHTLVDKTHFSLLLGWMPDSQKLLIVGAEHPLGSPIQLLDEMSGAAQSLNILRKSIYDTSLAVSPDGYWIAYVDKVPGKFASGMYISRLDGSEKRLLVQLDGLWVTLPFWSPDGNWLAFHTMDLNPAHPEGFPTLMNLKTCQLVALPGINGQIQGWAK